MKRHPRDTVTLLSLGLVMLLPVSAENLDTGDRSLLTESGKEDGRPGDAAGNLASVGGDLHTDWQVVQALGQALGKPEWRPMLRYAVQLHARSTHRAVAPFEFDWEEIGPGYGNGPAFGHWDIVHEILDLLPFEPAHARRQLLNDLRLQLDTGFLPGSVWMPGSRGAKEGKPTFNRETQSHPPVWVVAAEDYLLVSGDTNLLQEFHDRVVLQIGWFERARRAKPEGYFYNDILLHKWESGVDEGVRFDDPPMGARACVDTTAHVYQLLDYAAHWAGRLDLAAADLERKRDTLRGFIQSSLWDEETGFFYDVWAVENRELQTQAFEGLWPLIVGAARTNQAQRVIDEWVLNPKRFFTPHPIATVGVSDPKFELRMWRGPAWNSMTYWTARGCVRYGRPTAARRLLEAALDDSAAQFARTGTIWEYYHPQGGEPESLARKPHSKRNQPWPDYLGHNPLLAMARLWQQCGGDVNSNK